MSVYDNDDVRLPSVRLPKYKRDKLYGWLKMHGRNYRQFVLDMVDALFADPLETQTGYISWSKNVREIGGKMVDEFIERKNIDNKAEAVYSGRKNYTKYIRRKDG